MLRVSRLYCSYQHKLNQELTDRDLEKKLSNVSSELFGDVSMHDGRNLLLYDSIGKDNIALSLQYLIYMVDSGAKFTYILIDSKRNKQLLSIAQSCPNCDLVLMKKSDRCIDLAIDIHNKVISLNPDKIVLHMSNTDVIGFVALYGIKGAKKIYINHGDEQFWIGVTLLDYCIEFRNLGKDISSRLREIETEKILLQPYYPLIEKGNFQGLDIGTENEDKLKIFSGGRFIKAYGRNLVFLEMVRKVLMDNPNTCFIYAGNGNSKPMEHFITKNGLNQRWFIIPYRKDLFEVMSRMDVYLSTFPLIGGLMSQTAAMAGIPIVELDAHAGNRSEDVLPLLDGYQISCESLDEYYTRIKLLLNNPDERKRVGVILQKSLITKEEFEKNFTNILNQYSSNYDFKDMKFDEVQAAADYLTAENTSVHDAPRHLRNRYMICFYPVTGISNLIKSKYYAFSQKSQI